MSKTLKEIVAAYVGDAHPRLWMNYNVRFRKVHFEAEYWLTPVFCRRDKISVDVGVNEGRYSHYMAKHSRQVIGFEPNTDLWPRLNRLLSGKVRLESAALSDKTGSAEFRYVEDNTGVATVEVRNALSMVADPDTIKTRTVDLRTLDSFALTDVSFIKIDVEGHEESVIAGASETLTRCRPVLLIESEDRHNPGAPQRLTGMLADMGYAGFFAKDRSLQPIAMLKKSDVNPASLAIEGGVYINNFIYIPNADAALIDRTRAAVSRL